MALEKEKDVSVEKTETIEDAKSIAKEMAKAFADEMKEAKEAKEEKEEKEVPAKVVEKAVTIEVKDVPCGKFKSVEAAHAFAKSFVPKNTLEKFNNEKALTTYQNITTDADGGSFDPTDAQGMLADSVAKNNSYEEDTLQVKIYNSVGTFIDHTSDATAYMIGENTAITESKPGNTTRTITQKKIAVNCPITNEVFRFGTLADIASETLDAMGRAIATKKQWLIFGADGTADTTDGGITGVIPAIAAVGATNKAYYTVSGDWGDLTGTDLARIVAQAAGYADPANFAWYAHSNMWGYLEGLARTLGGNSYLVQTGQRPVPYLFGYLVEFVNHAMPSAQVDDEVGLLFGDLKSCVATGTSGQTYVDTSSDFYFDSDVTSIRAIQHMGVNVYQPGTTSVAPAVVAVQFDSAS